MILGQTVDTFIGTALVGYPIMELLRRHKAVLVGGNHQYRRFDLRKVGHDVEGQSAA